MGFGLTSRLRLEKSGAVGRPRALLGRVRSHVDWLFSPEIVLDILTGAAGMVVLAYLVDLGGAAVLLGAFLTTIVGREVRHVARDWSRRKRLSWAALLTLISAHKQGLLPEALRRAAGGARHWASSQLAPAAAATAITAGGLTATEAVLDRPSTFFGGEPTIAAIGFYAKNAPQTRVESGATLRACRSAELVMVFDGGGAEKGTAWSTEVKLNGKVWNENRSIWPDRKRDTLSAYYTRDGKPTGQALPNGRWTLSVAVDGDVVSESAVTLVNDAC
jgi:hypothetical protein